MGVPPLLLLLALVLPTRCLASSCNTTAILSLLPTACSIAGCNWSIGGATTPGADVALDCPDIARLTTPPGPCAPLANASCSVAISLAADSSAAPPAAPQITAAAAVLQVPGSAAAPLDLALAGGWTEGALTSLFAQAIAARRVLRTLTVRTNRALAAFNATSVLRHAPALQALDLAANALTAFSSGPANVLPMLQRLHLADNRISHWDTSAAPFPATLALLNASGSGIRQFQPDAFRDCACPALHLQNNSLTVVPAPFGAAVASLDLTHNAITSLQSHDFASPFGHLSLAANPLREIGSWAFDKGFSLTDTLLLLDGMAIEVIQPFAFFGASGMRIFLGFNNITALANNSLALPPDGQLQSLDLSHNPLSSIQPGALPLAVALTITHTHLTTLQAGVLRQNENFDAACNVTVTNNPFLTTLQTASVPLNCATVNFSSNAITALPYHMSNPAYILSAAETELSFSNNKITSIAADTFRLLDALSSLDLSFNSLTEITSFAFRHGNFGALLDLSSMPLQHIASGAFSQIFSKVVTIRLASGANVEAIAFPEAHVDLLEILGSSTDVDWATALANMSSLGALDLSHNQLTSFDFSAFSTLSSLPSLILAGNSFNELLLPLMPACWPVLDISDNPRLAHLVSQGACVDDFIVSGTKVGTDALNVLVTKRLVALDMGSGWDAERALKSILESAAASLEAVLLDAPELDAFALLASFIPDNELVVDPLEGTRYLIGPGGVPEPNPLPSFPAVNLVGSPLFVARAPTAQPTLDQYHMAVEITQLYRLSAKCIPGYEVTSGRCRRKIPFSAKPVGVATIVCAAVASTLLIVLLGVRVRHNMRGLRNALFAVQRAMGQKDEDLRALRQAWVIHEQDLTLKGSLGRGMTANVFSATWQGRQHVAVKLLRHLMDEAEVVRAFEAEAEFLMHARHPNVLAFHGMGRMESHASDGFVPPFLVFEVAGRGALDEILLNHSLDTEGVPNLQRLLAADIARGMAFIHGLGRLHRDLKSGNVLVSQSWIAKVADFGSLQLLQPDVAQVPDLSDGVDDSALMINNEAAPLLDRREGGGRFVTTISEGGTLEYMPPERLRRGPGRCTKAMDVWSFGCIVWELLRQRGANLMEIWNEPRNRRTLAAVFLSLLEDGKYLPVEEGDPEWAETAMKACFQMKPKDRPTFEALLARLEL